MTAESTGRCLCGAVTYVAAGEPGRPTACHCTDCARSTGGVFFGVHFAGGVVFGEGDALRWFRSSSWAERGFCRECGSTLFYRLVDRPGYVVVTAGTLDDRSGLSPLSAHFFIDSKPPFYDFAGEAPRLTGAEVFALFQASAAPAGSPSS